MTDQKINRYYLIHLRFPVAMVKQGWWSALKAAWGVDVFVGHVPFLKTVLALNILGWLVVLFL